MGFLKSLIKTFVITMVKEILKETDKTDKRTFYNINVDKPTKTVTIHGSESSYKPAPSAKYKQSTSGGNFGRDGGWFTGVNEEMLQSIIKEYEKKGYKIKRYKA